MKRRIPTLLLAAMALATLPGCDDSGRQTKGKPLFLADITGRAGEVLLVVDNDIKNDTSGRFMRAIFEQPMLGLPSDEPLYDVLTVPRKAFNAQLPTFRNLVYTQVADTIAVDTVKYGHDQWAKPQAYISVQAGSKARLLKLLERHEMKILSFVAQSERDRIIRFNRRTRDHGLTDYLRRHWNIAVDIPTGYNKNKSSDDFTWVSTETPETSVGMFFYSFPYVGEGTFSKEYLLNKRDSLLHFNIEGPKGSFMCTELRADITYRTGTADGLPMVELRGLWRMNGYLMGGPFVLRAIHDTRNDRVFVMDGYVYYPSKDRKREKIRQIDAIMYSARMLPPAALADTVNANK